MEEEDVTKQLTKKQFIATRQMDGVAILMHIKMHNLMKTSMIGSQLLVDV